MTLSALWNGLLRGFGQLIAFFYDLIPSYGIAIILLTVAVRTAMIPLTIKQTRSMQATAKLQPEIQRLRAKHKGDRQKLNEETQKLWQEHGVNPLGGCLPMVLQAPVFFALFQVFQRCGKVLRKGQTCPSNLIGVKFLPEASALSAAIQAGKATFLGMNLSVTPLQAYRLDGLAASIPYFLCVLLMAATTYYQQRQIMGIQTQSGTVQPQAQMMGRIMPVMLGAFSLNFPVALTIYWVTSNLWTIGQQYLLLGRKPAPVKGRSAGTGTSLASDAKEASAESGPTPDSNGSEGQQGPGRPKGSGARKKKKRNR